MAVDFVALFIAFTVVQGLAIVLTFFRLLFRFRIQRLWWEDMWAAVMAICGMTFIIGQLVALESVNYRTALITGWIASLTFTSTVWATRMSLLYSTIRVISPSSVLRKFTRVMALFFLLFWATIIMLKTYWCVNHTTPRLILGRERPVCVLPKVATFFQVTADCLSDAILVNLPLKLLWRVNLPRRLRRMILCLFSSSAIMSIFSLFHTICYLVPLEMGKYIAFNTQLTSALILCNLLVLVTYMYRVILSSPNGSLPSESDSSSEDDDFTTPIQTSITCQLTTVDLDVTVGTYTGTAGSDLNLTAVPHPHYTVALRSTVER